MNKRKSLIASGVASAVILGCGYLNTLNNVKDFKNITSSAIVKVGDDMMIVDLVSYYKYTINNDDLGKDADASCDSAWILCTSNQDTILVDTNSTRIIDGENSHEMAILIAEDTLNENGQILYYDDSKTLKRIR
jgi:hypothetical protein